MKKEVIIVADSLEIGGIERSLINMLDEFDYSNFNVDLMLYDKSGELLSSLNKEVNLVESQEMCKSFSKPIKEVIKNGHLGIAYGRITAKLLSSIISKTKNISETGYYQVQYMYNLTHKFLKKEKKKYDIAIGYAWPHNYILNNVDSKIKIGWIHTDYATIKVNKKSDLKMWSKLDYIIAVSKECANTFLKVYPELKEKMIVIENICGPNLIRSMAKMRLNTNLVKEKFNILSIGRLCNAKGFDIAVKVLRRIHDKGYKNIVWNVIGFGPDKEKIKEIIKENNLEKDFILHGKQINPYPYLKMCDLYVQPSRYEGKSVTVTEAQILAKPIIISNYETAKSQINHMVDGYISNLSVNDLADAIIKLYEDTKLREKFMKKCDSYNFENKDE